MLRASSARQTADLLNEQILIQPAGLEPALTEVAILLPAWILS